jgi:hypothetical protein
VNISDVERLHAIEQANRPIFSAAERAMVEALVAGDQPSFTAAMNEHALGQWLNEKAEALGDHASAGVQFRSLSVRDVSNTPGVRRYSDRTVCGLRVLND